jgi:metallo-beta-lactamase class B
MPGINPGVHVSGMPKFPEIAEAYARTFHDQKEMKIDVWFASHADQFDMHSKYKEGTLTIPIGLSIRLAFRGQWRTWKLSF